VFTGLEPAIGKVFGGIATSLGRRAFARRRQVKAVRSARPVPAGSAVERAFLSKLPADLTAALGQYLESAEFEQVAFHYVLAEYAPKRDEALSAARDELRLGLKRAGFADDPLATATHVVDREVRQHSLDLDTAARDVVTASTLAVRGYVAAASVRNGELLERLANVAEVERFATDLRDQVRAAHAKIRPANASRGDAVPYRRLYVEPQVIPRDPLAEPLPISVAELLVGSLRAVVLGDPGAGKSTLAGKVAYDLATDAIPELTGRVPLLVVLREFTEAFQEGGRPLVEYLASVCRDPYNVEPPPDALEYLLLNGRAVVMLDGLDELTDTALRGRVVQLVEAFVQRYPLVRVLATSREIGYAEAALDRYLFPTATLEPFDDERVE
jgi:hypothetical protein